MKRKLYQKKIEELLGGIPRVPSGSCFSHSLELAGYFPNGLLWEIALGHELLEDTQLDEEGIKSLLGECGYSWSEVNLILIGVVVLTNQYTKGNYPQLNRKERKTLENQRISQLPSGYLEIKLQDRLLNLRDIKGLSGDFQKLYKEETLELIETIGDNPNEDIQLKITQLELELIKNN
jgi:(p)ppGpp synthase/HD superfamily hydrolase